MHISRLIWGQQETSTSGPPDQKSCPLEAARQGALKGVARPVRATGLEVWKYAVLSLPTRLVRVSVQHINTHRGNCAYMMHMHTYILICVYIYIHTYGYVLCVVFTCWPLWKRKVGWRQTLPYMVKRDWRDKLRFSRIGFRGSPHSLPGVKSW